MLYTNEEGDNAQNSYKLFISMLEKLLKEEHTRNGVFYLHNLVHNKNFLFAVAALAVEVFTN